MIRPLRWTCLAGLLLLPLLSGCSLLGWAAAAVSPEGTFRARYTGLAGQRVAVIAWTDRATDWQYPMMGSDVRSSVSLAITDTFKKYPNADELKQTVTIDPRTTRLWQKNHPEYDGRSLNEVAPKLAAAVGATRVLYVELTQFQTRDPQASILLRGTAVANIRLAEVSGSAVKIGYEEVGITVNFPEKATEGVPSSDSVDEQYVFRGLVSSLGFQVAGRFFSSFGE